jgi:uncharacterized membrane protein
MRLAEEPELPAAHAHIEEAAQSIAQIHAAHHQGATPHQRLVDRVTRALGQPWFIALLSVTAIVWISFNVFAEQFALRPFDPVPFAGLAALVSLGSFSMTLLILATQRHENDLAEKREQLTLELALLSDQKTAKIIELLEEFRRDLPLVHDRVDLKADAMAQPADAERMLKVIADTHAEAVSALKEDEPKVRARSGLGRS